MVRLRHRIHDLRRAPLQRALRVRHALYQSARDDARRARLPRDRDADPRQGDARGRARFPGAEPPATRRVLRAAAVAADHEAAADDRGLRALLPDRALLPRRGSARRSPARVHADRLRDVVRRRRGSVERARRGDGAGLARRGRRRAAAAVPASLVRRRDGALRLGQARHARTARARRVDRPVSRHRVPCLRCRGAEGRRREVPADPRRRRAHARRDRPPRVLREEGTRREGPRMGARWCRWLMAVADREVPLGGRARRHHRAHRRAAGLAALLRRRRVREGARDSRPPAHRPRPPARPRRRARLGAALRAELPGVRARRARPAHLHAHAVRRARGRGSRALRHRRPSACAAPTTTS